MATVQDVLQSKGSEVAVVGPEETVLVAARAMNDRRIGSLVVVEGGGAGVSARGRPVGIITERDILTRVVALVRDPATTKVKEVMTPRVITCTSRTTLDELRGVIREKRIRHIPVVENGLLCGLVSIGDLNVAEVKVMTETIKYYEQYMYRG